MLKSFFGKRQSVSPEPPGESGTRKVPGSIPVKSQGPPPQKRPRKEQWHPRQFDVPIQEGKTRFHDFNLPDSLMHAIADLDFKYCMPVQAETIPHTLAGRDATARAQTGTGKTAAFLVTVLTHLVRKPRQGKRAKGSPRALILAPTRELVLQIEKDALALSNYMPIKTLSVFGGMDYNKQKTMLLESPVDIIAATPGRLIDFLRQKVVRLDAVEILVIDEADRMLDMGFIPDMRKIIYATPHKDKRQTLFFSATLSPEILRMAGQWTKDPVDVEIDPDNTAAENINQKVYIVTEEEKLVLLYNLIQGEGLERVILFVNRRDATRKLASTLAQYDISCEILSGEVSQKQRIKTLEDFRNGQVRILVATDVAARGLHIDGVSHVVNYDLPQDPEHYIHRIGRTGRAGADGISVSFADEMSSFFIPDIESVLGKKLECEYPGDELLTPLPPPKKPVPQKKSFRKAPDRPKSSSSRRRRPGGQQRTSRSRPGSQDKKPAS